MPGGKGDRRERFERIYEVGYEPILAFALRRTATPEDAADVVAETFLTAWRRLAEVPDPPEARLWLYATARRVLANQRRGQRRYQRLAARLRATRPERAGAADVRVAIDDRRAGVGAGMPAGHGSGTPASRPEAVRQRTRRRRAADARDRKEAVMTQEHDPIDEYVRRVAPLDEEALARLTAPPAKRELLNRILSQPVPAGHAGRVAPPAAGTRRRRLAIAGAAAGLLLAAGSGTVAALHGSGAADRDRPPAGTAPSGPPGDGSVALDAPTSCAFPYDPDTLAERAGFAFDGSVTGIAETAPGGAQVTFRVEEWFRGGEGDEFTIEIRARRGEHMGRQSLLPAGVSAAGFRR